MATTAENPNVDVSLMFSRENINSNAIACGDLPLSVADHARLIKFGMVFVKGHDKYTVYDYRSKRRDLWGDGREWINFHSRFEGDGGVIISHSLLDTGELVGGMRSLNHAKFRPSSMGWPCVAENYRGETWKF
jgi:hypothetical protein